MTNSSDEAFWPDNPRFRLNSNPYAQPEYIMEGHKCNAPATLDRIVFLSKVLPDEGIIHAARSRITAKRSASG